MRVLILGGTKFIGRALVDDLCAAGHDVVVIHRGVTEREDAATHLHLDRHDLPAHRRQLAGLQPDAVVDSIALTRADAESAVAALPAGIPIVVLSSMDVYAAWDALLAGTSRYPVPLDETSPVRTARYPYRDARPDLAEYDKLDVEEVYAARHATVCRLPAVFGPHDAQRREEFVLRRVRGGRDRIPFGAGNWLWSRVHVADAARGLRLMVERRDADGEVFHLVPRRCLTIRQYAESILDAAGHEAELVRVSDEALPNDLQISAAAGQHLLGDGAKARRILGWDAAATSQRIAESVQWHLANPPDEKDSFEADDAALAAAG